MMTLMPLPGECAPKRRSISTFKPVSSKTSLCADSSGSSRASMKPPGKHQSPTYGSNLRLTRTMPESIGTSVAVTGFGLSQCTNSHTSHTKRFLPPSSAMMSTVVQTGQLVKACGKFPALGLITMRRKLGKSDKGAFYHLYLFNQTVSRSRLRLDVCFF